MSWRELWSVQGRVKKFWKIKLSGKSVTEQFGRVGSAGEQRTQDFPSREAAKAAYDKLIQKKQIQGWFDKPDPKDARTNILLAIEAGNLRDVRECLRQDPAAVHCRGGGSSHQPLHWAVHRGHAELAKVLLDAGADINARGEDGKTPVLYAVDE